MPSSWLSVPHFQQELEYSCVAACARMVLAQYGDIRTETELRLLLDTQPTDTRAGNSRMRHLFSARQETRRIPIRSPALPSNHGDVSLQRLSGAKEVPHKDHSVFLPGSDLVPIPTTRLATVSLGPPF
jgi:hypothetical protein